MEKVDKLIANYKKFADKHPEHEIHEAIKEGYEVGFYDEETGYILILEMEGTELKVKVVMESHFIGQHRGK